ncbi:MAG: hypothetical protein KDC52_11555 [Ignavibacteriae bacterium]|nr:hypothetical protein [Ignavibacteriota bacterium]
MIIVFIFFAHIVFMGYVFYKRLKKESFGTALIDLTLIILLFSVGWSIAGMLIKLFIDQEGFGEFFDRDAISLVLLSIVEFFFYKMYYKDLLTNSNEKEK